MKLNPTHSKKHRKIVRNLLISSRTSNKIKTSSVNHIDNSEYDEACNKVKEIISKVDKDWENLESLSKDEIDNNLCRVVLEIADQTSGCGYKMFDRLAGIGEGLKEMEEIIVEHNSMKEKQNELSAEREMLRKKNIQTDRLLKEKEMRNKLLRARLNDLIACQDEFQRRLDSIGDTKDVDCSGTK
uniref:Uncharacterized protein n=1 Tax=Parastrongyloides trichosuri TaxID=131310 RepID=A0A0N4Z2P5_PARTI